MNVALRKQTTGRRNIFDLAIFAFVILLCVRGWFWFETDHTNQTIAGLQAQIDDTNKHLGDVSKQFAINKYAGLEKLASQQPSLQWSDRISMIVTMLDDLKDVDTSNSNTIVLNNFQVNLDDMSLDGTVSSLKLLYGFRLADKVFTGVIDRFVALPFIDKMEILNYSDSSSGVNFTLHAKVNGNGTAK